MSGSFRVLVASLDLIQSAPLPGPSAVICMADAPDLLAVIPDQSKVVARLDLIFNDASEPFQIVTPPGEEHARKILQFVRANANVPNLVIQCQAGVGRSQAVLAALCKIQGEDNRDVLANGTYNRKLYRHLLLAAGLTPDPEPLVSMAVRVKYAPDRLLAFLLCMRRQRYDNWEVVAVTDGPNPAAAKVVAEMRDPRVRLIETEKPLGRWGHPYRQRGLDACRGEFIGMSNDDNYYVPGYFEQMVHAMPDADLAICPMLHSYFGWRMNNPGSDLGAWLARATLIRKVPWTGVDFTSDRDYIRELTVAAKGRVVTVDRALFVHN
jgi:hypothetical protein